MADGAVDVDAVLKDAKERYKTVEVRKDIDLQLDVGNLLASDVQPIELKEFRYIVVAILILKSAGIRARGLT